MKFGALILILSSPAAWAGFGNIVPDSALLQRPCGATTFERSAAFLHKVALMPMTDENGDVIKDKNGVYVDGRGELFELGPKMSGNLALNSAELDLINNASPMIECHTDKIGGGTKPVKNVASNSEKSEASGFLYGNGEQYVTAAHSLFDSGGALYKSCVLRASANSELKDRTPLDLSMIEIINDPTKNPDAAIAVVKLKSKPYKSNGSPLEGLELNSSGKTIDFGDKLGMISSLQYKGDRHKAGVRNDKEMLGGAGKQPVIQEVLRPLDERVRRTPIFYGQASTTEKSSGSYGYRRDSSGKIVVDVVFTGGGFGSQDGAKFRIDKDPNKSQFAYGVILDSDKVKRMMEFQDRRKLQGMEANARSKGF